MLPKLAIGKSDIDGICGAGALDRALCDRVEGTARLVPGEAHEGCVVDRSNKVYGRMEQVAGVRSHVVEGALRVAGGVGNNCVQFTDEDRTDYGSSCRQKAQPGENLTLMQTSERQFLCAPVGCGHTERRYSRRIIV